MILNTFRAEKVSFLTYPYVWGVVLFALVMCLLLYLWVYRQLKNKIEKFNPRVGGKGKDRNSLGYKFREICLNFDDYIENKTRLVLKTEPNSFLVQIIKEEFERSYLYRASGVFTGVALIITFILIGNSVFEIGTNLPNITKDKLKLLGDPIAGLQQKFFVSIAGIACSILYQFFCAILMRRLSNYANSELHLRDKVDYVIRESQDLEYQEAQASGAQESSRATSEVLLLMKSEATTNKDDREEIKTLIRDLKNIDVTVGNFAEDVTTRLENFVDRSIGEKLTELIRAQNASTEKMASQISEALSKSIGIELEKVFLDLGNKLPNIMSNGASDATNKMTETVLKVSEQFSGVATSMPKLVTELNSMVKKMEEERAVSQSSSLKVNTDLVSVLQSATLAMGAKSKENIEQQDAVLKDLRRVVEDLSNGIRSNAAQLQDKFQSGASNFSAQVSSASENLGRSLSGVGTTLGMLDQVMNSIRESNRKLLVDFSRVINEIKEVSIGVSAAGRQVTESVRALAEISKNLNSAPVVTQSLVERTSGALNAQKDTIDRMLTEMNTKTEALGRVLSEQYNRGVETIAGTFVSKIDEIEGKTKGIREIYRGAGESLSTSLEPLETLSDEIRELNKTIKELGVKRGA